MECPRCRKEELSPEGTCPSCLYKIIQEDTITEPESGDATGDDSTQTVEENPEGIAETDSPEEELPSWRQELSERLAALKTERENAESAGKSPDVKTPTPHITHSETDKKPEPLPPAHALSTQAEKKIPQAKPTSGKVHKKAPLQKTIASLGPGVFRTSTNPDSVESKDIRSLIDDAVARQSTRSPKETPAFRPEPPRKASRQEISMNEGNKLILLSRTLSGLIDLIFVVLCTGVFIISADYFSGIVILDAVSLIEFGGLFILIYFLYSIFFLAASGQTVGMMITDLRIVGIEGSRPSIGQLFSRCLGYLLSIAVLGAGLLWSLLDSKNRCFHDRFSNTSITRI